MKERVERTWVLEFVLNLSNLGECWTPKKTKLVEVTGIVVNNRESLIEKKIDSKDYVPAISTFNMYWILLYYSKTKMKLMQCTFIL
jgi:hypothetical protein